jgi:hypothetical protein
VNENASQVLHALLVEEMELEREDGDRPGKPIDIGEENAFGEDMVECL